MWFLGAASVPPHPASVCSDAGAAPSTPGETARRREGAAGAAGGRPGVGVQEVRPKLQPALRKPPERGGARARGGQEQQHGPRARHGSGPGDGVRSGSGGAGPAGRKRRGAGLRVGQNRCGGRGLPDGSCEGRGPGPARAAAGSLPSRRPPPVQPLPWPADPRGVEGASSPPVGSQPGPRVWPAARR